MLVEHLEHIARQQIEWQQSQLAKIAESMESDLPEKPSTVIPATESASAVAPLTDVLKELAEDVEGVRKKIKRSTSFATQVAPATVLRLSELQAETSSADSSSNLQGEVEIMSNYGLEPQEIAQRLGISLEEVDSMLQAQPNQTTFPRPFGS
jgi:DNA-directed RNA polymerase specialized sigma24 family protein